MYYSIFTSFWFCIPHSQYSCINNSICGIFLGVVYHASAVRFPCQAAGRLLPPFLCRHLYAANKDDLSDKTGSQWEQIMKLETRGPRRPMLNLYSLASNQRTDGVRAGSDGFHWHELWGAWNRGKLQVSHVFARPTSTQLYYVLPWIALLSSVMQCTALHYSVV